jgi:RimJ/RimL family protein N-acetyltransferase
VIPRALVLKTFRSPVELRTARTLLRQWKDTDLPAWIEMNADPEVRRYFPAVLTPDAAAAEAGRIRATIDQRGWGPWALEIPGSLPFAGFVGLLLHTFPAHFMPAVEIGWRLPRSAWRQGYATEAAQAAMQFAFENLELPELVSMTVPDNTPSQAVMKRLGFTRDAADDFEHPRVEDGSKFKRHVLYRLSAARHREMSTQGATEGVAHV